MRLAESERERERESKISTTSFNFVDLVCVFVSGEGKGTLGYWLFVCGHDSCKAEQNSLTGRGSRDLRVRGTWLTRTNRTHMYRHNSYIHTWHGFTLQTCMDMTHLCSKWHDTHVWMWTMTKCDTFFFFWTLLIYMRDMLHLYVGHDSFKLTGKRSRDPWVRGRWRICGTRLIQIWDILHSGKKLTHGQEE